MYNKAKGYSAQNDLMKTIMEEQLNKEAAAVGVKNPKNSTAIKVVKGVVTGLSFASGLGVGACTAYYTASVLTSLVTYEAIESKIIENVMKVGVVGLSTLAGTGVSNMIFETGDAVNDCIDACCDTVFMDKLSKAEEKHDNPKAMSTDNEAETEDYDYWSLESDKEEK